MLPEFLDEQAQSIGDIEVSIAVDQLSLLKNWLTSKEGETNRQVRPAWMEIYWALITLVEQRLQDGSIMNSLKNEPFLLETHIVARQVARQKGKRQLPTRFVTDEIKRLSHHQLDFINQSEASNESGVVIGWRRCANRRGLGFAFMSKDKALELCNEPAALDTAAETNDVGFNEKQNDRFGYVFLAGLIGMLVVTCLFFVLVLPNYLNGNNSDIDTLSSIQMEQKMRCGVDGLLPHFSLRNDAEQTWWGLDVELCKALGAALNVAVDFVKVSASRFEKRIAALENQEVHILFRNTSHTIVRDLNSKIVFGPIYFYEKEFFLDFKSKTDKTFVSLADLESKNICVKPGTSNELTLRHLQQGVNFKVVTQDKNSQDLIDNIKLLRVLRDDQSLCDFVFGNYYILKQLKADQERRYPERLLSLRPFEKAGFDPLAPVLLRDYDWQVAVSYTIYALLYADKLGITSYNVEERYKSGSLVEQSFLRGDGMEKAGLSKDWVYRIVSQVGNYSEIYFRSVICDYVSCQKPDEKEFERLMLTLEESRWPNKVFKENDVKPGILHTPRF